MGAHCAVCRQPITKQTRFKVAGTEAIHDACLSQLSQSVLHRLRRRHDEIVATMTSLEQRALRAENQLTLSRQLVVERERDLDVLRRDRDRLREDLSALRTRAADNEAAAWHRGQRVGQEILDRLAAERDAARRERDAARAELALFHALHASTPAREPAKDERDASEIRFSLLDLDKP